MTWKEHRAIEDALKRTPAALAELSERVRSVGAAAGLAAVGVTSAEPLLGAREQIQRRVAAGQHAGMVFTFSRPEKATTPQRLLPDAASVIVGAWPYSFQAPQQSSTGPAGDTSRGSSGDRAHPIEEGRIARYQWVDHYGALRVALKSIASELKAHGWRARVLADDNALVDRAAAHRAGIGWFGKNANILIPLHGSWFVLGSVVTDAPLPPATEPVADGCGTCTRCIPGCPTGAIVAPGVIDARRCLAWLVQAPGDIPVEFRVAMHDRIYGCDDCQEVCPENRLSDRRSVPREAPPDAVPVTELRWLATAPDNEILDKFGRWWLPNRDPDILRRNAVVALGNIGRPDDQSLRVLLGRLADRGQQDQSVVHSVDQSLPAASELVANHASWAIDRLDRRAAEPDVARR